MVGRGYKYSATEDMYIQKYYIRCSDRMLADSLGRTEYSVMNRRTRLGFNRKRPKSLSFTKKQALFERSEMRWLFTTVEDMKALIIICQLEENSFRRDAYKKELARLGNIKFVQAYRV